VDGQFTTDAATILKAKGVKVCARNISSVCSGKSVTVNGRSYSRRKAGGFRWFYADEVEKYSKLVQ
jgi:hypothetical protein